MQSTPKSLRLHIGLFGRRNVGKSSLLNAITRQQVSIVSEHAGTTTDPVEKPMELLPLGPVQFVDTAGVDDEGALGELRIARTKAIFERVDLGVIVTEADAWGAFEEGPGAVGRPVDGGGGVIEGGGVARARGVRRAARARREQRENHGSIRYTPVAMSMTHNLSSGPTSMP